MVTQKKNTKSSKSQIEVIPTLVNNTESVVTNTEPVVNNAEPVVNNTESVVNNAESIITAPKKQKGGAKKLLVQKTTESLEIVKDVVVESTTDVIEALPTLKKQKGGRKAKNVVNVESDVNTSVVLETDAPVVIEDDGKSRSFKVKLPNDEEFSGRFTGLTPYQAANKALSKYFRTNENTNINGNQVLFSIKESTRGSKRHEYTYKGTRIKLDQPITYTIKSADGVDRIITKQYKNQLTKVKKGNNNSESAPINA